MHAEPQRWLIEEGRLLPDLATLIAAYCAELGRAGFDVMRVNVPIQTLHPEVGMRMFGWFRQGTPIPPAPLGHVVKEQFTRAVDGGTIRELDLDHGAFLAGSYTQSPFFAAVERGELVRVRIGELGDAASPYVIIDDLRALGATDYMVVPLRFATGPRSAFSVTTDRPGGFLDAEVDAYLRLADSLAICFEVLSAKMITRSLVQTYVGVEPGAEVLAGRIRPGDVRRIDAALWFSDLRGFTTLAQTVGSEELIGTLNSYFSAVAGPLKGHGGEVLKYIGDATLAIFPVRADRDATAACADAIAAAREAGVRLDALNAQRAADGLPGLEHGIGVHFGEAEYGNVGAPGRLDFTVIGRDVNLASRVEGLCGRLGRRLLATGAVRGRVVGVPWEDLGEHELKGIAQRQRIYAA